MTPGLHDLPAHRYHADPCDAPSLSASIAHILLSQSPAHAWWSHPRLNLAHQDGPPTTEQDEGTALHAAILENRAVVALCEFPDWKTKAAQEARRLARETGEVPILARRWEVIQGVAQSVREQLAAHEVGDVLAAGHAEKVMVWRETTPAGPIWCRARVDWLPSLLPGVCLYDLKTVGGSAEPGAFGRKMANDGYALQAAFYLRGARALGLEPSGFRFIVVERDPPFGLSVCEMAPDLAHFASVQAEAAVREWGRCLHSDRWPSYEPKVAHIEAPVWITSQWEERALRLETLAKERPFYMPEDRRVVNSGAPFA